MKILLSPAKSLDFQNKPNTNQKSNPVFQDQATLLNNILKDYSSPDLSKLMGISSKLSDLNWSRNQDFQNPDSRKQAIFAFNGDVYEGIDINSMPSNKFNRLQESVRILSGLYGILKPFDLIKPYRLEMGTKLAINGSKNLYDFWSEKITASLSNEISENELIINLASNEYFSVINESLIKNTIITPQFKDFKNGKLKIISFFAKKARGLMTRYLIEEEVKSIEGIKAFNTDGYSFSKQESKDDLNPVFIR
jgi:cytoplasmic iron level regulating protein YaaA (DUF328/UPF0246 family)